MTLVGTLSTGEPFELCAFDGTTLALRVGRAFAPGAPLRADFATEGNPLAVELKCHGSRREPDGRFVVRGRVISMTRDQRIRLLAALSEQPADGTGANLVQVRPKPGS